jgi:hypothetical protein
MSFKIAVPTEVNRAELAARLRFIVTAGVFGRRGMNAVGCVA